MTPIDLTKPSSRQGAPPEAGLPQIVGRYEIVRRIGEGGFADVFLARDPLSGNNVALKVLREAVDPALSEQVRVRFLAEEKITNAIAHPSIVRVRERSGPGERPCFLVMDYLDGSSFCDHFRLLRAQHTRHGTLDPDVFAYEVARLGHEVAQGMAIAHDRGVVHRDLKPDNVLVIRGASGRAEARILDFGIAKAPVGLFSVDTAKTFTRYWTELGTVMGSPPYMAPEQNGAAHAVSGKADVFALGVLLLVTLLGCDHGELEQRREPISAEELGNLLRNRVLRPEFRAVLQRLLALEANDRPTMHDAAISLQRLAQPNVAFGSAVESWLRTGRLPAGRHLLRWAEWAVSAEGLTPDEQRFLQQAPAIKLRALRRRVAVTTGIASLAACGMVAGAGLLLERRHTAELTRQARQLATERQRPSAQAAPLPSVVVKDDALVASHQQQVDVLQSQVHASATQVLELTRLNEERATLVQTLKQQLAARQSERSKAETRAEQLQSELVTANADLSSCRRDADRDLQSLANCRREAQSQAQELSESTDRLRLCSRSLRGSAPSDEAAATDSSL